MSNLYEPPGRTGHVAATYEDCMLVWGGYKEHSNHHENIYFDGSELWSYHIPTEKWSLKECQGDFPPGTSGASAVVVWDHLYVFGGYRDDINTNTLYRLDLLSLRWENLKPSGCSPTPVDKTVGWEYKGKIYFFGGFGLVPQVFPEGMPAFQFVVADTPTYFIRGWTNQFFAYDIDQNKGYWPKCKGTPPIARAAHAAAVLNDKVYIFGGRHYSVRMNDLHCLDLTTMTWSGQLNISGNLPEGRSWHSLSPASSDFLILYGGFSQNNVPLSDCWMLDAKRLVWCRIELPFTKPRLWHSACVTPFEEIIVYGGCTQNILDTSIIAEHAKELVILRISPKSLFRICMDEVVKQSDNLWQHFSVLPSKIQEVLFRRIYKEPFGKLDGS